MDEDLIMAWQKDLEALDPGELFEPSVANHEFVFVRLADDGFHGRLERYFVACARCDELLHEASANPITRVRQHLAVKEQPKPIDMILFCPQCHERHIDEGAFATKAHSTHACQHCGFVWKPSKVPTRGVQFLDGYKDAVVATKADYPVCGASLAPPSTTFDKRSYSTCVLLLGHDGPCSALQARRLDPVGSDK